MTIKAFNLADIYQTPVVLLTDQDYGQNFRTVRKFSLSGVVRKRGKLLSEKELRGVKGYKRYLFTRDGISPRALPSQKNGIHLVESNEHDERGYRDESFGNRKRMMEKRMRKLRTARKDLIHSRIWGEKKSGIGIIGCGSTYGPIQEAREHLHNEGIRTKFLQVRTLWPFLSREAEDFIATCSQVFVVDNNYEGQLKNLIQSQVRTAIELKSILNYSGQTFTSKNISGPILREL